MHRLLLTFLFAIGISPGIKAQLVQGILKDAADKTPISNATIKLNPVNTSSSGTFTSVSNSKGLFTFDEVPAGEYMLVITSIGYANTSENVTVGENAIELGVITMVKDAQTLKTVVVSGAPPAIKQNNDTMEFGASQYKVNPDATSEDLIKKMPGITVDKQTGAVTAMGETVQKVTVDGRDFFGNDATATLRNLPADIIDKIQVFDKLSDQAQLTGFDDGNTTKSINIVTKVNMRNGNFGRLYAGYGTDDRYSAGGNVSFFNGPRRISFIGLMNNVNLQNFQSQDLLGVSSTGNRGGGGRRGGGSANFTVGQQNGIAKTNAFGINYSDAWGKKIDVQGSYFFNNSNTSNNQTINQQNIITKDSSNYYDENSVSDNKNYNNRVNFRLTYKIDSSNSILFTSYLNFQNNNSVNYVDGINYVDVNRQNKISSTINDLTSNYRGNNLNNQVLFRHAFKKRGRSISLGITNSSSDKLGDVYLNAVNNYFIPANTIDSVEQYSNQKNHNNQYNFNLEYTEPLGKKGQLQMNYNPSFSN
ncbi:MAG: carboxypeptidase regulatory-like domain-containing protein, partial [Ginsengibacter sp.]